MTKDPKAKLNDIETRKRRWQTRLKRAVNMLERLEKQQRRLLMPAKSSKSVGQKPADVGQKPAVETDHLSEAAFAEFVERGQKAQQAVDDLTVPAFLNRADPLIAEKMTAARKKAEEAARHAMPLTGRD